MSLGKKSGCNNVVDLPWEKEENVYTKIAQFSLENLISCNLEPLELDSNHCVYSAMYLSSSQGSIYIIQSPTK